MRPETWDIIVIGAGASGCMASVAAARQGARVLLLEKTDQIARKIPATGNGKCNFTNAQMNPGMFRGNHDLPNAILPQFNLDDTLSFFHDIGILSFCKNGYYYPNSGTASSVRNALEAELEAAGVQMRTGIRITDVKANFYHANASASEKPETNHHERNHSAAIFEIHTVQGCFRAKILIFATGLLASPKLGSNGSAFPLIRKLGHHFTPIAPALCGFAAKGMNFRKVSGVRTNARVTLYIDGEKAAADIGELQLTDYGVSGIPVFQISRYASLAIQKGQKAELSIDFLPFLSSDEANREIMCRFMNQNDFTVDTAKYQTPIYLQKRYNKNELVAQRNVLTKMNGLLHEKLLPVLLGLAGINGLDAVSSITEHKILKFCQMVKDCRVTLTAPRDYEFAQVCAGGIRTEEIIPETLESKLVPGLYFAGELLDVDGPCGGYNLQWAWSSGYVAGFSAAKRCKETTLF